MSTRTTTVHDRARGALLGLAWGDALGCPVETWSERDIAAVFGRYDDLPERYPFERIPAARWRRLRPLGLYSDDTQQGLALAHVLSAKEWSLARWAALLVRGAERGAWRGTGRYFEAAVARLRRGVPPTASGSPSGGMGAAMRVTPLGAILRDDPRALVVAARESSAATHADDRAIGMAVAIAWAAGALVRGIDVTSVREELPPAMRAEGFVVVADALSEVLAAVDASEVEVRGRITDVARPHLAEGFTRAHPNQGFALLGAMHGLAVGLRTETEPRAALAGVVRLGFDTDTVAAIAGGLLGSRFGAGWVPTARLVDGARLEAYADAVATDGPLPESEDAFLDREAALGELELEVPAAASATDRRGR